MIRLIGTRCTDSNVFSQGVLIVRFLLGNVKIILLLSPYRRLVEKASVLVSIQFSDIMSAKACKSFGGRNI